MEAGLNHLTSETHIHILTEKGNGKSYPVSSSLPRDIYASQRHLVERGKGGGYTESPSEPDTPPQFNCERKMQKLSGALFNTNTKISYVTEEQ